METGKQKKRGKLCSKCAKPAVMFAAYSGMHLCADHFTEFFERRVKKAIRSQGTIGNEKHVAVALSGGKDSTVTLYLLATLFRKKMRGTLSALTIDEGICGYRPESVAIAKKVCKELGVEHTIVRFKDEIGFTMDDVHKKKGEFGECTYCGVFRRYCLNAGAKRVGATKIATGHNLDDAAQSVVMNIFDGDVVKLARMGPHKIVRDGLIPRIEPLRLIPEKEAALYALLHDIPVHIDTCPYAQSSERNIYRKFLNEREVKKPGTKYAIISGYDKMTDALLKTIEHVRLNKCALCGEPTAQKLCMKCTLVEYLGENVGKNIEK